MAREHRILQFKRNRYYSRLGVPVALREVIGKRELIVARGADRAQALKRLPPAL